MDVEVVFRGYNSPYQKTYSGGVNRHFQAQCMKYSNIHIIKTTASIPTKFDADGWVAGRASGL